MSDADVENQDDSEALRQRVEGWLAAQMPIIQLHGGTSMVPEADPESGEVVIELGGTCSGCAISPRTQQMIKTQLVEDIEAVETVHVRFLDDDQGWDTDEPGGLVGIDRREGGRGGSI
ncbi:MAG: NifU family protein [Halobacteriales archaeon]